uniref:Uncharacterized protein n=1 Tax=Arundo donax TaxID=35708 RepID=A0A0A9DRX5_ARUDO
MRNIHYMAMKKKHGELKIHKHATAYQMQNPTESEATGSQLLKKSGARIRKKSKKQTFA